MIKETGYGSIDVRELALSVLSEVFAGKEFSHRLIRGVLDKHDYLQSGEKAFLKRLTEGTLEQCIRLDYCIDRVSSLPVRKMKPFIRTLLRMSAYQILFMDGVPHHAVCNEAVKLAKKHSFGGLQGFVNGVLRQMVRRKEELLLPPRGATREETLSFTYAMPLWLVERFLDQYGEEETLRILEGLQQERGVTVRISPTLSGEEREVLKEQWKTQGIRLRPHPLLSYGGIVERLSAAPTGEIRYGGINPADMAGFAEGKVVVQDVSSMLVAEAAGILPGMKILDVCSAPGGKATHAAQLLKGSGLVVARDISEKKIALVRESGLRQGLSNLRAEVFDAACFDPSMEGWADVVICDLPCSGLGVIGKKKDIKFRIREEDIRSLEELQKKILRTVHRYVKPGGLLLYSTCTVNRTENQETVRWLMDSYGFRGEPVGKLLKEKLYLRKEEELPFLREASDKGKILEKWGLQLVPTASNDGFFIAVLRRPV
ncbi:MAG: 16S rRNA (cytosine(967)-C(5))-methyltransferase RsmB [Lachnospiraceae bacterium]|nr:16S rRNA (cytosine(967)-C(5))-methyltransferase RsmB [Lachnospiraceae bacterium]